MESSSNSARNLAHPFCTFLAAIRFDSINACFREGPLGSVVVFSFTCLVEASQMAEYVDLNLPVKGRDPLVARLEMLHRCKFVSRVSICVYLVCSRLMTLASGLRGRCHQPNFDWKDSFSSGMYVSISSESCQRRSGQTKRLTSVFVCSPTQLVSLCDVRNSPRASANTHVLLLSWKMSRKPTYW